MAIIGTIFLILIFLNFISGGELGRELNAEAKRKQARQRRADKIQRRQLAELKRVKKMEKAAERNRPSIFVREIKP